MLEELGLPREISIAPRTEATDSKLAIDAHAPNVIGDAACERLDTRDVVTPMPQCIPC
jgi:hypothetical protein